MENLNKCFNHAWDNEANYIGVLFRIPRQDTHEVIINSSSAFAAKQRFYKENYNDDLTHSKVEGLRIVGFTYGKSFADIENDLFGIA
jgi:hypothetical protein